MTDWMWRLGWIGDTTLVVGMDKVREEAALLHLDM